MYKRNIFYYDESFHTRVITKGYINDQVNCDSYVGVAVGWNVARNKNIRREYQLFEEQYKEFYGITELKSQIIKRKFYKYGLACFKKEQLNFYNAYFAICEKKIYIYLCILSKMETIFTQLIGSVYGYGTLKGQILIYTLTKSILLYKPENVLNALFNENSDLLLECKKFMKKKMEEIRGLEHKVLEYNVFQEFLQIIDKNFTVNINFEWCYDIAFWGLKLLIEELNLNENRLSLILDKEGEVWEDSKTLLAAKRAGFPQAIEMDSKDELGIRIADLLCGFVGRIIRAIEEDLRYKGNDFKSKKLLNPKWFELNKEQFKLYQKIAKIFFEINYHYYMSYGGIYGDQMNQFFSLFQYIYMFKTYNEFSEITSSEHTERFNFYTCQKIEKDFQKFGKVDNPTLKSK